MWDWVHEEDTTIAILCALKMSRLILGYGHRNGMSGSHVPVHKPVKKNTKWWLRPACQGCKSLPLDLAAFLFYGLTAVIKHVNFFE